MEIRYVTELEWGFTGEPWVQLHPGEKYGHTQKVYPNPAYTHEKELVEQYIHKAHSALNVDNVVWNIVSFETLGRTNGWAQRARWWGENEQGDHVIFLGGKSIPIHPAMTRYLATHEYGHVVQYHLEQTWDLKHDELIDIYAEARGGIPKPPYYGPGTWHLTPGEIFANDFRIIGTDTEIEFWPHPTVPKPWDVPGLYLWWTQTLKDPSKERLEELRELIRHPEDV